MRRFLLAVGMCSVALLAACASTSSGASWAEALSDRDSANAAGVIAAILADRITPGEKPVLLVSHSLAGDDRLQAHLKSALEARGYVLQTDEPAKHGHHLRYLLTAYAGNYVLRVELDGMGAAVLLSRAANGELIVSAPLAVREAAR